MTEKARAVTTLATALVIAALCAGCDRGPSQEDRVAASAASQARVQAIAEEIMKITEDTAGDLPLDLDHSPEIDDREGVCDTDLPRAGEDPARIQWIASRRYEVNPPQDTAARLDAIVEPLLDDGWDLTEEEEGDGWRSIDLYSDRYSVSVYGDSRVEAGTMNIIRIHVYGPCIDAPASTP